MRYYYFPMDDKAVYLEKVRDPEPPKEMKPSNKNTSPREIADNVMVVEAVTPEYQSDPLSVYLESCLSITSFLKSNNLELECYLGNYRFVQNKETLLRRCAIIKNFVPKDEYPFHEIQIPEDINIFRFVKKGIDNQFERCRVPRREETEEISAVFLMTVLGGPQEASPEYLTNSKLSPLFESEFSPLSHTLERTKYVLRKVIYIPEVEQLLGIAGREIPDSFRPDEAQSQMKHSFVVIEGMDATGKTTLTKSLESKMAAKRISQPPQCILHLRSFFDDQPEIIRRSYYILGNYITAVHIALECQTRPVVADRFWHSSAVNAIANETSNHDLPSESHMIYTWPRDLLLPDIVLYLKVTEEFRTERIRHREETMTGDERQLEENSCWRNRLREAYRRMHDPPCVEVDGSGSREHVLERVRGVLLEQGFH